MVAGRRRWGWTNAFFLWALRIAEGAGRGGGRFQRFQLVAIDLSHSTFLRGNQYSVTISPSPREKNA